MNDTIPVKRWYDARVLAPFRWALRSMAGALTVFTLVFAIPEVLFFGTLMFLNGQLNVRRLAIVSGSAVLLGFLFALIIWFTFFGRIRKALLEAKRLKARQH